MPKLDIIKNGVRKCIRWSFNHNSYSMNEIPKHAMLLMRGNGTKREYSVIWREDLFEFEQSFLDELKSKPGVYVLNFHQYMGKANARETAGAVRGEGFIPVAHNGKTGSETAAQGKEQ